MSTSAEIGRSPIAVSRSCSQRGLGPFLHAADRAADEERAGLGVGLGEMDRRSGCRSVPATGVDVERPQPAEPGRREIAGDAVHAEAIGAVGRDLDLDHRIVEPEHLGEARADRRRRRQLDDALVIVGEAQLAGRAQHAVAIDAADLARFSTMPLRGMIDAGRREDAASCRRARWARRTRPARCRLPVSTCRRAAGRRWDAARPRRRARR